MSRLIEEPLPDGTLRLHRMSIAEVERDACGRLCAYRIFPYERELPFTTYHDTPWRLS